MNANRNFGNGTTRLGSLLFSFRGRMPRATFWWTLILVCAAFVMLMVALEAAFGEKASLILYPPFFWIVAALAVKRLRDRGRRPVWLIVLLVPILGPSSALAELALRGGTPGETRYGQDRLGVHGHYLKRK